MSIRIGIMTYYHAVNYGAFLQSYALSERLNQEEDFQAEIVNYRMQIEADNYMEFIKPRKNLFRMRCYIIRNKTFEASLKLLKLSKEECVSDHVEDFINLVKDKYDVLIAGSDEIWKFTCYRGFPTPYYLPGDLGSRKLAYAVSGRIPFSNLPKEKLNLLHKYLQEFEYIGTRDITTYHEVVNLLRSRNKVYYNYDPTFIYDFKPDREHGRAILKERYHINLNKKCIGVMFSEKARSNDNLIRYLKKCFGSEIELVSLYDWEFGVTNTPDLTPLEWVDVVAALDIVISHYFHAICFSIITGTPFFAIEVITKDIRESKIYDLLVRFDLLSYYTKSLPNVIETGKLRHFVESVEPGSKRYYKEKILEAKTDFENFVKVVRCKENEESKYIINQ